MRDTCLLAGAAVKWPVGLRRGCIISLRDLNARAVELGFDHHFLHRCELGSLVGLVPW